MKAEIYDLVVIGGGASASYLYPYSNLILILKYL